MAQLTFKRIALAAALFTASAVAMAQQAAPAPMPGEPAAAQAPAASKPHHAKKHHAKKHHAKKHHAKKHAAQ